jgi:WD repeat-containing protein 35
VATGGETSRAHEERLAGASWDSSGGGGRLALATDTALFIVLVKLPYIWAQCQSTMAYVHALDPKGPRMLLWDMATDEMQSRPIKSVVAVQASSRHFLIVTEGEVPGQYSLVICDAIGTSLDSKPILFLPQHVAMSATHIVAARGNALYVWNYCNEEVRCICCSSFCMHAKNYSRA